MFPLQDMRKFSKHIFGLDINDDERHKFCLFLLLAATLIKNGQFHRNKCFVCLAQQHHLRQRQAITIAIAMALLANVDEEVRRVVRHQQRIM